MARLNKVFLIGYISSEIELKQTPAGTSICSFSIAVNRRVVQEGHPSCDFISCVAWRDRAEFVSRYFRKGKPILICGELQVRSYVDKQGNKRYVTEVIVNEAEFVDNKSAQDQKKDDDQGSEGYNPYSEAATAAEFEEVGDDALPF